MACQARRERKLGGDAQAGQRAWRLITADLDGGVDSEQVGLGEEHPLSLDAELPDLRLRQLHLAPAAAALHEPAHHLVHRRALHRPHRGPRHHHLPAPLPAQRRRRRRVAEEREGVRRRRRRKREKAGKRDGGGGNGSCRRRTEQIVGVEVFKTA